MSDDSPKNIKVEVGESRKRFYVTECNIMYLRDGCWFLVSCVIQHYAPVVGGGREQRKSKRERGDVYTTRVQMALTLAVWCELAVISPPLPPNPPQPVEISITTQHNSMGPTQQYGPWIHLIYLYIKSLSRLSDLYFYIFWRVIGHSQSPSLISYLLCTGP
jgi:hypothetical protein